MTSKVTYQRLSSWVLYYWQHGQWSHCQSPILLLTFQLSPFDLFCLLHFTTVDILFTFDPWYYLPSLVFYGFLFPVLLTWLGLHGEFVNLLPYNFPRELCFFSFYLHLFLQSPKIHYNLLVIDGLKNTEDFSVDPLHFWVNFKLTVISKHCHRTTSFLIVWIFFHSLADFALFL